MPASVAAALGVVEPAMSSLAGMGVARCWIASEGRVSVLDFTGRVPLEFPADRITGIGQLNRGALSCGVPSNLAGWAELIAAHGKKSLGDALEPATALAQDGFPVLDYTVDAIQRTEHEASGQALFAEWRRTYVQSGVQAGSVLRQPDLARTLAAISANGPSHLYDGPLGRALVDAVSEAGGCITMRDLAAVHPAWVAPLDAAYRGCVVHAAPPPSEAFQYLLTLRILDGFDIVRHPPGSADHLPSWQSHASGKQSLRRCRGVGTTSSSRRPGASGSEACMGSPSSRRQGVMTGGADPRRDGTAIAPTISLRLAQTSGTHLDPDAAQQQ